MVVDASATFTARVFLYVGPDPIRLRVDRIRTYAAFEAAPMVKWRGP